MLREIETHKVNALNEAIQIAVMDEPGAGNACHAYELRISNDWEGLTNCHEKEPCMPLNTFECGRCSYHCATPDQLAQHARQHGPAQHTPRFVAPRYVIDDDGVRWRWAGRRFVREEGVQPCTAT